MDHSLFKKLDIPGQISFTILNKKIEFELDAAGNRIQYFNVDSQFADNFISVFGEYSQYFYTSFVNIETNVPPHTDIVDKVNINFYIETGGYKTTFYKSNDNSSKMTYADHGNGHVYQIDDLEEIGSFIAVPGDVYVLNGKVVHGVYSDKQLPRKFLQVATNKLEYDQVLEILNNVC